MTTIPGTNPLAGSSITAAQLQSMDLETALMTVQTDRAKNLEGQLRNQLELVKQRNADIASLQQLMTTLRTLRPTATGDGAPETMGKLGSTAASGKALYDQIKAAGLTLPTGGDEVNGSATDNNNIYDAKQKTFDTWIEQIKGKIDEANSSQQMEMLTLQSLSNKRNEAFEIMTNFIKKMSDNRSAIVGNMR